MKKLFVLALAVMLALLPAAALAQEGENDLLARIQQRGSLIIATEGNWSPWTYHDENDVLTGFDIEIGALIAKGLGVVQGDRSGAFRPADGATRQELAVMLYRYLSR